MANRKKENPLVRVTLSLDPNDYKSFECLAKKEDRSTSYLIRQAMRDFLNEHAVTKSPSNAPVTMEQAR